MKEDIMMQDEERTLILEKERGNVRTFFQLMFHTETVVDDNQMS